jgi:hypothetical protein
MPKPLDLSIVLHIVLHTVHDVGGRPWRCRFASRTGAACHLVHRSQEQVHRTIADLAAVFDSLFHRVAEVESDEDA